MYQLYCTKSFGFNDKNIKNVSLNIQSANEWENMFKHSNALYFFTK